MSWWDVLTKQRKIPGFPYGEDWWSKNHQNDDATWYILWKAIDAGTEVPLSRLSGPVKEWLQNNGPKA